MQIHKKRCLAILICVVMTMSLATGIGTAKEKDAYPVCCDGYNSDGELPATPLALTLKPKKNTPEVYFYSAAPMESAYSSVEQGYITSVKDQGQHGTCWAFAAVAAAEADAIKNEGYDKNTLDLSELHLAYFNSHMDGSMDPLSGLKKDKQTDDSLEAYLQEGGNSTLAMYTWANWIGAANESDVPYQNAGASIEKTHEFKHVLSLRNAYKYSVLDMETTKKAIKTYGAVTSAYYAETNFASPYYSDDNKAYYQNAYNRDKANHAITIVGWDDNYSKNNFGKSSSGASRIQPQNDGAWLIKNSWSDKYLDKGYFWLSYEDKSIADIYVFDMQPGDTYDNNYQYDSGLENPYLGHDAGVPCHVANVFQAAKQEVLRAVGISVTLNAGLTDLSYTVNVFKNPSAGDPSSGTLISSASGNFIANGFYTIELNNPAQLTENDTFAVCVETQANVLCELLYDKTQRESTLGTLSGKYVTTMEAGQSYIYNGGYWDDLCDVNKNPGNSFKIGNFRIKAFTKNGTIEDPSTEENTTTEEASSTETTEENTSISGGGTTEAEGTTAEKPTTTEEVTTAEKPTTTEEEVTTAEKPTTTEEEVTTAEKPTTTEEEVTTAEKPTTTEEEVTTAEKPTTTEEEVTTAEKPTTTEEEVTTAEKPTTPEEGNTAEKPTTPEEGTTAEKPSKPEDTTAEKPTTPETPVTPTIPEEPKPDTPTTTEAAEPATDTGTEESEPIKEKPKPKKKGTVFTHKDSKAKYVVTSDNETTPTVAYKETTNETGKTCVVPARVEQDGVTYKVTSLSKNAFKNNKSLTTVRIGSNVTTIGASAFYGCSKLKYIILGERLVALSDNTFYKCTAVTAIVLPEKLKQIGRQAFYGCKKLGTITVRTTRLTAKTVGANAFKGIKSGATFRVPKSKMKAYKKLFKDKGAGARITVRKN